MTRARLRAGKELYSISLQFPEVEGHPNRIPCSGVLALVDVVSDLAPSGALRHRVKLTRAAAVAGLPGLLGMGLSLKMGWDGHDLRRKVGIITAAEVDERELRVRGYVYANDFPEVSVMTASGVAALDLGMSFEVFNAQVEDRSADVWVLTQVTFTGAAVLLRSKAAYQGTSFHLDRRSSVASVPRAGRLDVFAVNEEIAL